MSATPMSADLSRAPARSARITPMVLQSLSILAYAVFAITVSIVAMMMFSVMGLVLAIFLAYQWRKIPALAGALRDRDWATALAPRVDPASSGNASFDRYRAEVLAQLEDERVAFGEFVQNLRAARDQDEFDTFMSARRETAPSA